MAKLTDCLEIHFGDKEDAFIVDMVKAKAKELSVKGRVTKAVGIKAINAVIADFKADNQALKGQIKEEPKEEPKQEKSFDSVISELKKQSPGRRIFNIHQVRKEMGNPDNFNDFLETARKDQSIQLHGGDPSSMTKEEIRDS
jgi:hypothetical protein